MKRLIFILVVVFPIMGIAQDIPKQDDVKVGLVLSGGGAKGLAHIGVLKKLDEAGIRVDYIGGTSMGAIVGALYASGYSGMQLDSIFEAIDFEALIRDDVPRSAKTFYERSESEKYALSFPFDDFQLRFPSGISKGQNVYNLLSRLLAHVQGINDFNDLPIPFLCIATDVEQGKQVVFKKGYLPRAITASGALPSLFNPVTIGDTLYVDGGVVNNYPIDEVRAMGADVIIGVDVQDTLRSREQLQSALDILVQINNYRTIEGMRSKRQKTDIYISPNMDEYTVISFNEGAAIIKAGETAADAQMDQLLALANKQPPHEHPKLDFNTEESVFVEQVEIKGNTNYTRAYILGKLKLRIPSQISYAQFSEGVNNLAATGNFSGIEYQLESLPDSEGSKIIFNVRDSDFSTSIKLAAHYDDLYKSAALVNLTRKRVLTNNDIFSIDLIFGDNLRYNLDYYIDKGYYWSIGFNSRFIFFNKNVGLDFIESEMEIPSNFQLNKIGLEYEDLTNRIYLQTLFRRVFQLELGAEHKWLRYLSETIGQDEDGNPRTLFENTHYFSAYGTLLYDSLDDKFFPTEGWYFLGDFHTYIFADGLNEGFEPFSIAKAKAGLANRFSSQFSTFLSTEGGVRIGSNETNSLDFMMGGYGYTATNNFIEMYGYDALDLRGDTYLKASLDLDFEFIHKNHLVASMNIANIGNRLFETGDWYRAISHYGFAFGYGLETFLGPIELKYSYAPDLGEDQFYVSAGFRF